jgi:peptidyl-prolyl cis-trans isomerase SurA
MHLKFINKIALSLLMLTGTLYAQTIDAIAAIVENHIILKSDIQVQYQQMLANDMGYDNLECEILDQLLLEKIFAVEAERDSIYVSPEEVDGELSRRIQYFVSMFGSEEKLEEYYGKKIFDLKEEFRDDISQQLLSERMQNKIFSDIHVSPREVFEFFNSIPKDSLPFFNAEVEIGQIVVFAEPSFAQKSRAREKAERIKSEIEEGGDFEFLALLHSDDPGSATRGGNLGFVKRGELVGEFEAAAFRLKPGEISDVVETVFGFHIIQLIEKKGDRVNTRHILISPGIENENVEKAEQTIQKVKEKLQKKEITFQQAVAQYSKDDMTKNNGGLLTNPQTGNNFFEMNQLDGDVALALDNMNVGDFSDILPYKSMDGKYGFRIIYLRSETPAHQASLETDYSKIKAVTKQAKQAEILNEWMQKKSKTIFIRIHDDYQDCTTIGKWNNL